MINKDTLNLFNQFSQNHIIQLLNKKLTPKSKAIYEDLSKIDKILHVGKRSGLVVLGIGLAFVVSFAIFKNRNIKKIEDPNQRLLTLTTQGVNSTPIPVMTPKHKVTVVSEQSDQAFFNSAADLLLFNLDSLSGVKDFEAMKVLIDLNDFSSKTVKNLTINLTSKNAKEELTNLLNKLSDKDRDIGQPLELKVNIFLKDKENKFHHISGIFTAKNDQDKGVQIQGSAKKEENLNRFATTEEDGKDNLLESLDLYFELIQEETGRTASHLINDKLEFI